MKIGNYYRNRHTGLLMRCTLFTRSNYCFIDTERKMLDYPKEEAFGLIDHQSVRSPKQIRELFQQPFAHNQPWFCLDCCGTKYEISEKSFVPCLTCQGTGANIAKKAEILARLPKIEPKKAVVWNDVLDDMWEWYAEHLPCHCETDAEWEQYKKGRTRCTLCKVVIPHAMYGGPYEYELTRTLQQFRM